MGDLDAKEVLLHLNQLGYQNITAKQLKEFMKDLKKLIKYEKKHRENNQGDTTQCDSPCSPNKCPGSPISMPRPSDSRKEHIVSVKIKRSVAPCPCKEKPVNKSTNNPPVKSNSTSSPQSSDEQKYYSDVPKNRSPAESVISKRPKSCDIKCQKSKVKFGACLRPKSSFIIPKPPIKICKSDPVALYHKYQECWKRQSVPGESSYSDLRWAVREQMLGQGRPQTMSAAPSMEAIARKRTADKL